MFPMSLDSLAVLKTAPATLAPSAAPNTSKNYAFIDTRAVVDLMAQEGYRVTSAKQSRPRVRDPLFARHMIEFRRPADEEAARHVGGAVPRLILTNSHDGSSTATVMAGMYRFVCSNGLVIGTDTGAFRARHSADAAADVIHRVRELAKQTDQVYRSIDRWSRVDLTRPQREEFAKMAAVLRWGNSELFEPEQLLQPRRGEDDAGNLWSVFNRVQENTVRGGMKGLALSGRRMVARPIADIQRDISYNAELWALAEEFAA